MNQTDLFAGDDDPAQIEYWRRRLREWPQQVFIWRHFPRSTGWSVASQSYIFARMLCRVGQITRQELRRWWRFDRRVQRWERRHWGDTA